jgi:regulator of protease activity HflC (stomatin/prohibitin superfamily)
MNRLVMIITALAVAAIVAFWVCIKPAVSVGNVGVIHEKPLFFGKGGVVTDQVVATGTRQMFAPTTDIVEVPNVPQSVTVHTDDVMSSNKVPLDFDIAITVAPASDLCAAKMLKSFGQGPLGTFARFAMPNLNMQSRSAVNPSGEFMSYFRDGVRRHHMDEYIIGQDADGKDSQAITTLERSIVETMNAFLGEKTEKCLMITNVSIGKANPPEEVKGALSRTAEQVQLAKTERERTTAQIARKAAEEASADADKAQQTKLGFTNDQYLQKQWLETILKVCGNASKDLKDKADGNGNCTLVVGQAIPMVQAR